MAKEIENVAVGYADDFGALALALAAVAMYIDIEVERLARLKMTDWFGDADSTCVLQLGEPEIASDPVSPGASSPPA